MSCGLQFALGLGHSSVSPTPSQVSSFMDLIHSQLGEDGLSSSPCRRVLSRQGTDPLAPARKVQKMMDCINIPSSALTAVGSSAFDTPAGKGRW